ncbi:MAG: M56 family metallopeptidase, partial [Saprospiraceae bacterium]|nr:M56 family metallopeptidase [Saprospiraceae bacterium]
MIDFISNLVSSTVLYNLAMTILHSLWQGAVLVLLMNLYLKYSHNNSPTFRYNIAFATLILLGISVLATFSFYSLNVDWGGSKNSGLNPASEGSPLGSIPIIATTIAAESFDIKKMIPLISGIWIIGVGFFTMRLLFGYAQIIKIRKSLVLDIPNWLVIKVNHLKKEYGIDRNIKVGISQQVLSPLMMGVIRPIIIFPVAAINQLTPEEIELILRHELGHIIRQDYVQNFIIRTMEVLMFYHPCIWWTTRIIEKERENHCDDYAVQSPENRMFYAKTLVKIREMRASQHYQLALGFSKDNQSLLNRIKRILSHNQKMSIMKGNLIVGIVLLSSLICLSAGTYFFNKTKIDLPERIEVKDIRSLDISIPTFPIKLISSPQDTSKEELRKMIRERQEKIREKSREAREASRELREELRELRKQNGDHSYRIRVNRDWDEKDWEEFSEKMEKWGEEFEA